MGARGMPEPQVSRALGAVQVAQLLIHREDGKAPGQSLPLAQDKKKTNPESCRRNLPARDQEILMCGQPKCSHPFCPRWLWGSGRHSWKQLELLLLQEAAAHAPAPYQA